MAGTSFGQTRIGRLNRDPYYFAAVNCPVSTTLVDGSILICKAGGTAWFWASESTRIDNVQWANGQYNNTNVGNKCCISEWGVLEACLQDKTCCYRNNNSVYSSWFVPSIAQLCNPVAVCRTYWAGTPNFGCPRPFLWASTQTNCERGCRIYINPDNNGCGFDQPLKCETLNVRALKCVTY